MPFALGGGGSLWEPEGAFETARPGSGDRGGCAVALHSSSVSRPGTSDGPFANNVATRNVVRFVSY